MLRLAGWLVVLAVALAGHVADSAALRAACVPLLLLLLGFGAPPPLRPALCALALASVAAIAAGRSDALLDAMPAGIAALVGCFFARTLRPGRAPLIARAIAAIDGPQPLEDAQIRRYARRLTLLWTVWQFLLAAIAALLALRKWFAPALAGDFPGPRLFGLVVLPVAVAALAIGELALRPRLLPQAPRRSPLAFVAALVRAWPSILRE